MLLISSLIFSGKYPKLRTGTTSDPHPQRSRVPVISLSRALRAFYQITQNTFDVRGLSMKLCIPLSLLVEGEDLLCYDE